MGNSFFRFKQFTIRQEGASMKVGTDGVLLGAWVDLTQANSILDVGSGTGLISIMLAQRCSGSIDAIEIDTESHLQAMENLKRCPWSNRIALHNISFQEFSRETPSRFDLIVSNPPYFVNSLKPNAERRANARHAESLTHSELLQGVAALLTSTGRFCGIFPYIEGNVFVAKAANSGLYCRKKLNISSRPGGQVKRIIVEFSQEKGIVDEQWLAIYNHSGEHTQEYRALTKEFYLAF